jgi:ATP-binding cassette subfamily B protein
MAKSTWQRLYKYVRPHQTILWGGIASLFVVNALGIYIPLLIRDGVDELRANVSFDRIWYYALLIFGLSSVMLVIRMLSRLWLFGMGRQVEFDIKQALFQHILTLEPAFFSRQTAGDLINRSTSDVDNIRRFLGFAILSIANTIFAYGLTLPVMLSINWWLSLAAVTIYPVMLFIVTLFGDRLREQQTQVQEDLSKMSELVQEDISGIALVKIYAQEDNERRAFRQINNNLLRANLRLAQTRNVLFPIIEAMAYISLLILLGLGTGAIANGSITVGGFVALLIYAERLVFPTALLGFTLTIFQRGEVSIERIESILRSRPEITDQATAIPLPISKVTGQVEARNLCWQFPGAPGPALTNISFTIEPGETVAIVGPIGSGKSTLANALPRLLNIAPGQLFLDGYDITQVRLEDLRRAIAYVPQESFLFSTTIKNNIRYGDPIADQPRVVNAAEQAQIHQEVLTFPQEYDTIVGERGITLSGGQRQRTALARALLVDAPVLILDDALASVDNQTATNILQKLAASRRTVIFISHQLAAAAQADRILVMESGKIIQTGRHPELLKVPGLYRQLWEQYQLEEVLS